MNFLARIFVVMYLWPILPARLSANFIIMYLLFHSLVLHGALVNVAWLVHVWFSTPSFFVVTLVGCCFGRLRRVHESLRFGNDPSGLLPWQS